MLSQALEYCNIRNRFRQLY